MCFLTCYPQLLFNFVYKVPLLAETLSSVTGLLSAARFLFSRDMIIAEVGPPSLSPHTPNTSCSPLPRKMMNHANAEHMVWSSFVSARAYLACLSACLLCSWQRGCR